VLGVSPLRSSPSTCGPIDVDCVFVLLCLHTRHDIRLDAGNFGFVIQFGGELLMWIIFVVLACRIKDALSGLHRQIQSIYDDADEEED